MPQNTPSSSIYTTQFILLCTSSFLFFVSFQMIIPELPAYLTSLGGADYKGLIIGLFTLTALISRPFSGKLADKIGRIPTIVLVYNEDARVLSFKLKTHKSAIKSRTIW